MIDATFNRGKGVAKGGVEYVLADSHVLVDHDNNPILKNNKKQLVERHPKPEVVRGDPQRTIDLIEGLDFKNRYTSGALSWEAGEEVTKEKEDEIIDAWEQAHFPGLDQDRYDVLWVRHEHAGHHELHYIIPKVDLETGKYLNPKPPTKDYALSNAFRRIVNLENGWSDPNDPERKQLSKVGSNEEIKSGFNKSIVETRVLIEQSITQRIEAGIIRDASGIKLMFDEMGFEIKRQGVTKGTGYISVSHPSLKKNIRLKGAYFESNFKVERELDSVAKGTEPRNNEDIKKELFSLKQRLRGLVQARAKFNKGRYSPGITGLDSDNEQHEAKELRDGAKELKADNDANGFAYSNLSCHLFDHLGIHAISTERDRVSYAEQAGHEEYSPDMVRKEREPGLRENNEWLASCLSKIKGVWDDGIRKKLNEWAERIGFGTSETSRDNKETNRRIEYESARIESSISSCSADVERGVSAMRENRSDELERFKTDINLAQYLSRQGFEMDIKASTKNSVVMRQGESKLVVATDSDNHGIYFDVNDDSNNGTIIDWVKKNLNKNLGEVRKELRPEVGLESAVTTFKPKPVTKDLSLVVNAFHRMPQVTESTYLKSRGIEKVDSRFKVYEDMRKNVIFPHFTADKTLTGFEKKNKGFTGFSGGGEKTLFVSSNIKSAEKIYICESAIDAISLAELKPEPKASYVSIGGKMSPKQKEELKKIVGEKEAIAALDNDNGGREIKRDLDQVFNRNLEEIRPKLEGSDWNEELIMKQAENVLKEHENEASHSLEMLPSWAK